MFLADRADPLEVTAFCKVSLVLPSPHVRMSQLRPREAQLRDPIPKPGWWHTYPPRAPSNP